MHEFLLAYRHDPFEPASLLFGPHAWFFRYLSFKKRRVPNFVGTHAKGTTPLALLKKCWRSMREALLPILH